MAAAIARPPAGYAWRFAFLAFVFQMPFPKSISAPEVFLRRDSDYSMGNKLCVNQLLTGL
jgi:hypothetical protein